MTSRAKPFTALARQTVAAARKRYERGETLVSIAAALKVSAGTISNYAKNEGWTRPGAPDLKQPAQTSAAAAAKASAKRKGASQQTSVKTARATRVAQTAESQESGCAAAEMERAFDSDRQSALVDRIWRAAEKQVAEIERRIGASEAGTGERDARALAVMTRMLRELAALKGTAQRDHEPASIAEDDDDDFDRDVDEYCAKVTRMLESMRERRDESAAVDAGNAASNDRADGDELAVSGQGGSVSA